MQPDFNNPVAKLAGVIPYFKLQNNIVTVMRL